MPRFDDVTPERIPLSQTRHEADCEYTGADFLVKKKFSTSFS
jgi:hypothetical protein